MRVNPQIVSLGMRTIERDFFGKCTQLFDGNHTDIHTTKAVIFTFHSHELAFTFQSFSFPAPALENFVFGTHRKKEGNERRRKRRERKLFENKESGAKEDKNRRKCLPRHIDVKMNCLFIDNTLLTRK